jgi:uncharacterized protein YrrD
MVFKPKGYAQMTHSDQISETIGYSVIAHKEGAQLGDVVHVFFDPDSKNISGMTFRSKTFGYFNKNLRLPVDSAEIKIGPDQIMVPSAYSERVEEHKGSPGFLRRIFSAKEV